MTRAIYHILTHKSIEDKKGGFSKDWLTRVWKQRKYNGNDINLLEKLLLHRYFEVCYSFDDKQSQYIMPLWLPDEAPAYSLSETYHARYQYRYAFLPLGFISHLIIRFHASGYLKKSEYADPLWHWRKGLLLEHKEGTVEMRQTGDDYRNANITVTYRGHATAVIALKSIVSKVLDVLHAQFDIHYKRYSKDKNPNVVTVAVECSHCIATGIDSPHYHNMADLIIGTKDDGRDMYQSNFTYSTCKTEIVAEKLVHGVSTQNDSGGKSCHPIEQHLETQGSSFKTSGDIHVNINHAGLVNTAPIEKLNTHISNAEQGLKSESTTDIESVDS